MKRRLLATVITIGACFILANCSSAKKNDSTAGASNNAPAWAPKANAAQTTVTPPAPAPKIAKETETSLWTCMKAKETRTLQVAVKDKGCELNYMKDGKNTVPASSTHSLNHCVQSEKKIKSKLETSGYTCAVKW